jgi:hypothetical protein
MAATVLNGTGTVNYTNSTGGNARVIINYFGSSNVGDSSKGYGISLTIGTFSLTSTYAAAIGKNLALTSGSNYKVNTPGYGYGYSNSYNMAVSDTAEEFQTALPIEFYLVSNQTFSMSLGNGGTAQYNILVIPENG